MMYINDVIAYMTMYIRLSLKVNKVILDFGKINDLDLWLWGGGGRH